MGTYSFGEYLDTFGGMPEPGETYPDDPDALRDEIEDHKHDDPDLSRPDREYETEDDEREET